MLSRRHSEVGWPVHFLAAFNFPSIATGYPFASGWTVSERPNHDPRVRLEPSMFAQQQSTLTTWPFAHSYNIQTPLATIFVFPRIFYLLKASKIATVPFMVQNEITACYALKHYQ